MRQAWATRSTALLALALTVAAALGASSCLSRRDPQPSERERGCTACHGDARRGGTALLRAAPPYDLSRATQSGYPGVGAHSIHLEASATHGAVACEECHLIPERVDSPGHADDGAPAEIVFGGLASHHDLEPTYDFIARRCDNTYCHGGAQAVWTEPRDSAAACGSCHELPPPAPHPQSSLCSSCHGSVVDEARHIRAPELHVNGTVELVATSCTQCHGSGDEPAPPLDSQGNSRIAAIGVGAHAAHLSGGSSSRPLACTECHEVPEEVDDFAHADGLPAEVALVGVAETGARAPDWDRARATCADSWCHGPAAGASASPPWNEPIRLDCTSCHGNPPPAPHPQMANCSHCHAEVVADDDVSMLDRNRHVDGVVDVFVDQSCTGCHGSENPAPPSNLSGGTSTLARGVGAHQTHVLGTSRSRAVACQDCHQVPEEVLSPGHVDTPLPAEVSFAGGALAFGATPTFANDTCSNTSCHGAVFPGGHASGGSLTAPEWSQVDGTQAACGTCHGLPPPRPHPYYSEDSGRCHKNLSPDGQSFLRPELHVDGVVTFELE